MWNRLFIYIGNDHVIESKQIISILDFQLIHLELKKMIEHRKEVKQVFGKQEDAKSIILTEDTVYYSPFSTITLKNREEMYPTINELEKE